MFFDLFIYLFCLNLSELPGEPSALCTFFLLLFENKQLFVQGANNANCAFYLILPLVNTGL